MFLRELGGDCFGMLLWFVMLVLIGLLLVGLVVNLFRFLVGFLYVDVSCHTVVVEVECCIGLVFSKVGEKCFNFFGPQKFCIFSHQAKVIKQQRQLTPNSITSSKNHAPTTHLQHSSNC